MIDVKLAQLIQEILNGNEDSWCRLQKSNLSNDDKRFLGEVIKHKLQETPSAPYVLTIAAFLNADNVLDHEEASKHGSIISKNYLAKHYCITIDFDRACEYLLETIAEDSSWAKDIIADYSNQLNFCFYAKITAQLEKSWNAEREPEQEKLILKLIEFLIAIEPQKYKLHYYKMRLLLQLIDYQAAISCYEEFREKFFENNLWQKKDYFNLANAYFFNKETEKACIYFYKAYLEGDLEDPGFFHRLLRELAKKYDSTAPSWSSYAELTNYDEQQLVCLVFNNEKLFNASFFSSFLQSHKVHIKTLIEKKQLTFQKVADIILEKGNPALGTLFKFYCQDFWDVYFGKNLKTVIIYLATVNDDAERFPIFQALLEAQQKQVLAYLEKLIKKNTDLAARIKVCQECTAGCYLLLGLSRAILRTFFYDFFEIPRLLVIVLLPLCIVLLLIVNLILLIVGALPALVGLIFSQVSESAKFALAKSTADFGGNEGQLERLSSNLMLFQSAPPADLDEESSDLACKV